MALERQLNIELKVKQGAENMIPIYANGAAKVTHTHAHRHIVHTIDATSKYKDILYNVWQRWSGVHILLATLRAHNTNDMATRIS